MNSIVFPALASALLLGSAASAGEVSFASKPITKKQSGKVVIEFAAGAKTDCAVYILDAKGKVIRHLAAGVLGEKSPAPLSKGLAQKLVWDGKDDQGRPALSSSKGPFKVRVGLGLKPALDKFIGGNPAALGEVRCLATNAKGEVFVFHIFGKLHPSDSTLSCSVFSREGKYLRQILPYPANLPDEKLTGLKRIDLGGGSKVPFIYQAETRSLVPGAGEFGGQSRAIATSDGRVAFAGIQESPLRYAHGGRVQVTVLGDDGSAPGKSVLRTLLAEKGDTASLALSPDEKTIYATGVRLGVYFNRMKPTNVVYKFGWDDEKPRVLIGEKGKAGADGKHLSNPMSLAVDKDGNLYVADKGNDRVAVFKPDGALLGEIKVAKPERVEVHAKSGAIYVLGGERVGELNKFASWKKPAAVATAKLPSFKHPSYTAVMALDASAEPPVLWVGAHSQYARFNLLRIEDRGKAFGEQVKIGKLSGGAKAASDVGPVTDLALDREREILYTNGTRSYFNPRGPYFDGRTGQRLKTVIRVPKGSYAEGTVLAVGLDKFLYMHGSGKKAGIYRFDREVKPAPFAGSESNYIANAGSLRLRSRGLTAGHDGKVYVLWQTPHNKKRFKYDPQANSLAVYGADGKLIKERLIDSDIRSLNSVRVDRAGNIYLALGLRPGKQQLPPGLKGRVAEGKSDPDATAGFNSYPLIYGSIAKFGPAGGVIRQGCGGRECNYAWGTPVEVKGAKWIFSGASNVPSWRTRGTPDICLCESPRFDVDEFGRSFFPDAGRFRVGVIDTGGNEICWFGSYGNQDSAGPKSRIPKPAIPLHWPQAVAVGDEAAYIADRLNRRVARVKLEYAAEESVQIP